MTSLPEARQSGPAAEVSPAAETGRAAGSLTPIPDNDDDGPNRRLARGHLDGIESFWVGVALFLPLLFINAFALPAWAPRYAMLPVIAGVGLTGVPALLLRRPRRTAILAAAFGAWAALASGAAGNSTVALWGRYPLGTGLVFVLALIGAWAGGASLRAPARGQIERALLAACVVNASVAVVQKVVDLSAYGLATFEGRSAGLYGNPVYLAGLLAGGLWLALCRLDRGGWAAAGAVVLIGAAVDLTGSRFGLLLALVAVAAVTPRLGWRRAGMAAVLLALGLAAGTSIGALAPGTSATSVDRAGEVAASGVRPRIDTWYSAIGAVAERPLLGWGPSGFLAATSPRRSLATARSEGPDVLFADAHNLIVEYAVTTGLPGLALLGAWLVCCLSDARLAVSPTASKVGTRARRLHPLTGFALFILAISLVEPLHVGVTPLAFLALGAAGAGTGAGARGAFAGHSPERTASVSTDSPPSQALVCLWRSVAALIIAIGMAVTVVLGTGLLALRQADLSADPAGAVTATNRLPAWAEPSSVVARLFAFRGLSGHDPAATAAARHWWAESAGRDPDDPARWNDLGGALGSAGNLAGAKVAFSRALDRNPWSRKALSGLAEIESQQGHPDLADGYRQRATRLSRP
jgi:O-antigen ligase